MIKVFLDMDGVLADFVSGAVKAHKKEDPYLDAKNYGIFDMEKLWNITSQEFWKPLDYEGYWLSLDKTKEADFLVEYLSNLFHPNTICILSSPSYSKYCIPEKIQWIKERYPDIKNFLFGSCKEFLGQPNAILIDDRDKNISDFNLAGGNTVLFPRLWNKKFLLNKYPLQHVVPALAKSYSKYYEF